MECNLDQTIIVRVLFALNLPALQTHWHFCCTLPFFLGYQREYYRLWLHFRNLNTNKISIDSLVVWPACSTIPRASKCGHLIHHSATIKSIFRVLVIFYLSGEVLVTSLEFLQGYLITLFVPVSVPVSVRHSVWWEAPPLQAGAFRCQLWLWGARYATQQLSCSDAVSLCHEEDFSFPPVPCEVKFSNLCSQPICLRIFINTLFPLPPLFALVTFF